MRDVATLLEALPYIREFHGSTVVIKYGGAAMDDPELREEFARDVVLLKYVGMNPVVVHGGGPDITAYMERLGMPVEFVGGLRVSDEATVEIAKMVLVGKLNTDIVLRIGRHGQPAVGLSGDDGGLLLCSRRSAPGGQDIGFVGQIERVDAGVINHIALDYIPVVASVGADREGNSYNVNADEAAAAIAVALNARTAIFLTDVRGWLEDPGDPDSLIAQAGVERVLSALETIDGGMRPKLQACVDAVRGGVGAAQIIDGRVAALAAARALHRRRHRHEGHGMSTVERFDAHLTPNYARYPVTFARGDGARLWDVRRQRVPRLPRRHLGLERRPLPSGGRRGDPRAGAAAAARRQPLLHRADGGARAAAGGELARRQGLLHQLRHRGGRGGAQVRAQGAPGRHDRVRIRRLPRAHLRLAVGHAAGVEAGAVRAAGRRLRQRRSDASTRSAPRSMSTRRR